MTILLVVLSVLALWAFLTLLVVGLLLILKTLESVRLHLQKIAAGVRAIEQETKPLEKRMLALTGRLDESGSKLGHAADGLVAVEQKVAAFGDSM